MGDLDDFFAKKDKKKRGTKGFSKANTDILAKNLEEMERREQSKQEGSTHELDMYLCMLCPCDNMCGALRHSACTHLSS